MCKKHDFCPINGQLEHCQRYNHHEGCIHLTPIPTENPQKQACIYKNGYIKPNGNIIENPTEVWWCQRCKFSPQNEDLARCLNQNKQEGCVHLIELLTEHPYIEKNPDINTNPVFNRTKRRWKRVRYNQRKKNKTPHKKPHHKHKCRYNRRKSRRRHHKYVRCSH